MAGDEANRNCFTFIWKVENADYWWVPGWKIESPSFTVDQMDKTSWKLHLTFYFFKQYSASDMLLERQDTRPSEIEEIDVEFAFLSPDGTVLHSSEITNASIYTHGIESEEFPSWNEIFFNRRSVFFPQNTLTVRCRMWKSVGEISQDFVCVARTRIAVEKNSQLWNIDNFSALYRNNKQSFEIESLGTDKQIMSLELFVTGGAIGEQKIRLKIIPNFQNIKRASVQLSIVDACKNTVKCFQDEFWVRDPFDSKDFTLMFTMRELIEKKSSYLPNNVLSLLCEYSFTYGTTVEEIEEAGPAIQKVESDETDEPLVPKDILMNDLKSMLNNAMLSDVMLKTRSKTHPAHKFILAVRSPMFKAMFSNDMQESRNDSVDMDDFSDETVSDLLRYVYIADVEALEWGRATELYKIADKYQILDLKDFCASYLKNNLRLSKACEALVLADLHHDKDLKGFVQDFILGDGRDVINSEEWDQLMETNPKLAAETMRLKFKE